MDMTVDCPKCGTPLRVPESAAGKRGRCTECGIRFMIPSLEELLDNTVSHFMMASIEAEEHAEEAMDELTESAPLSDLLLGEESDKSVAAVPVVPTRKPQDTDSHVLSDDVLTTEDLREDSGHGISAEDLLAGEEIDDDADLIDLHDDLQSAEQEQQPAEAEDEAGDASNSTAEIEAPSTYPAELLPAEPRPYLVVRCCAMEGVTIAFSARWLKHEVFRTSMPIRCAFTGDENTHELLCRPMIFFNRYTGPEIPQHSLETRHELKYASHPSPRELVRTMGQLDDFHEPFYQPVLFYVSPAAAGNTLHCEANTDSRGNTECQVLLPNHRTALQWLERVNGRCGAEYTLLKTEIAHYTSDAWRRLDEKTRQRLSVWCKFERGEKFRLYLNDPDFSISDAGLAGIAITDRRMLYHKYRHSRSISLNQDATLHVSTDGKIARLALQSAGRVAQCGKIHRADLSQLIEALAGAPRLRLQVRNRESRVA